ncbi:hypothetical protein FKM82_008694 [Ascaphus truei]
MWTFGSIGLWQTSRRPFMGASSGGCQADSLGKPRDSQAGVCWAFNDSRCTYSSCRFKHLCATCGWTHPQAKCFGVGDAVPRGQSWRGMRVPRAMDSTRKKVNRAIGRCVAQCGGWENTRTLMLAQGVYSGQTGSTCRISG